ncbi:hypothetical protein ACIGNX_34540 [Actinosynnema sp. NPDC053489]|uniref:hypothetical protein n=1 Tax=Actinosynnema sp. NPDC053489 TaxID=3363916 RepID=UPI0037C82D9D
MLLLLSALVAGCDGAPAPAGSSPVSGATWDSADLVLSSQGLGAVRIGMNAYDAVRAAGIPITVPDTPSACQLYRPSAGDIRFPAWRVSDAGVVELVLSGGPLYGGGDFGRVRTADGLRVGDPLARVREVYGDRVVEQVDMFGTKRITASSGDGTALRFDARADVIESMTGGTTAAIGFVELCG